MASLCCCLHDCDAVLSCDISLSYSLRPTKVSLAARNSNSRLLPPHPLRYFRFNILFPPAFFAPRPRFRDRLIFIHSLVRPFMDCEFFALSYSFLSFSTPLLIPQTDSFDSRAEIDVGDRKSKNAPLSFRI